MRILLVDDDEAWSNSLKDDLEDLNFEVVYEADADNTLEQIKKHKPDVVLLDILFHGENKGKPTFASIKKKRSALPVIILTSTMVDNSYKREDYPGVDLDYPKGALKPEDPQTYKIFADKIRRVIEGANDLDQYLETFKGIGIVVGESKAMRDVCRMILNAAVTDNNVLITGETGTGKDLAANAIHHFSNSKGKFVPINCSAVTGSLSVSEWFGVCAKVANDVDDREGYFERAHEGTIFLDEIGAMPLDQQAMLLRVLQDKKIARVGSKKNCKCKNKTHPDHTAIQLDFRTIVATNEDLDSAIKAGKFRRDLFRRIKVIHIQMPPLRERREDIETLAKYSINKWKVKLGKPEMLDDIRPDVKEILDNYNWPMNIGELEATIKSALTSCNTAILMPEDFSIGNEPKGNGINSDTRDVIQKIWDGKLKWDHIMNEFAKSSPKRKEIVRGIVDKWLQEKGVRPKHGELATLLETTERNIHQKFRECKLSLTRDWPKNKQIV